MTVHGQEPNNPKRAKRGAMSDNTGDNARDAAVDDTALKRFAVVTRSGLIPAERWLARYRGLPVVDVVFGTFRRDRRAAGWVISSALAFRLFLFFLPLLLLTIGVAGFAADVVDAGSVNRAAGI